MILNFDVTPNYWSLESSDQGLLSDTETLELTLQRALGTVPICKGF